MTLVWGSVQPAPKKQEPCGTASPRLLRSGAQMRFGQSFDRKFSMVSTWVGRDENRIPLEPTCGVDSRLCCQDNVVDSAYLRSLEWIKMEG